MSFLFVYIIEINEFVISKLASKMTLMQNDVFSSSEKNQRLSADSTSLYLNSFWIQREW